MPTKVHPSPPASTSTAAGAISVNFLRDIAKGGAATQPMQTANEIVKFVSAAHSSVDIAIYDFRLTDQLSADIVDKLKTLADGGVAVRIAYDHTKSGTATSKGFVSSTGPLNEIGGDPAPRGTMAWVQAHFGGSKVETRPIAGSHLMHNKYIVRDGYTADAAVLMGSANFTTDAWTHQENNLVTIASKDLAAFYERDFEELWRTGNIKSTGVGDHGTVRVNGVTVEAAFAPGEGQTMDHLLAGLVGQARTRIRIASMVITSHAVLAGLDDAIRHRQVGSLSGIYDHTQMEMVRTVWAAHPNTNGVRATFDGVAKYLDFKKSKPFSDTSVHNFMHDKIVVCDDTVATGSYNISRNATMNAENIILVHDRTLADAYTAYVDAISAAYGGATVKY